MQADYKSTMTTVNKPSRTLKGVDWDLRLTFSVFRETPPMQTSFSNNRRTYMLKRVKKRTHLLKVTSCKVYNCIMLTNSVIPNKGSEYPHRYEGRTGERFLVIKPMKQRYEHNLFVAFLRKENKRMCASCKIIKLQTYWLILSLQGVTQCWFKVTQIIRITITMLI